MKASNRLLLWPACGMVLFICMAAFKIASYGSINIRVYQGFAALGLLATLLVLSRGRPAVTQSKTDVRAFALALSFLFVCFASMLVAPYPQITLKQSLLLSAYMLVAYVAWRAFNSPSNLRTYVVVLFSGSAVAYLYGYLQTLMPYTVGLAFVEREISDTYVGQFAFFRPQSFFSEGNEFGQFMTFSSGMFFACSIYCRETRIRNLARSMVLALFPILFINNSRGTFLGIVAMSCIVVRVNSRLTTGAVRIRKLIAVMFIGALVAMLITLYLLVPYIPSFAHTDPLDWAITRITGTGSADDATFYGRLELIRTCLTAFLARPLLGLGYGNVFSILDQSHYNPQNTATEGLVDRGNATSANFLMDVAVETGVIGITVFFFLLFAVAKVAKHNLKRQQGTPNFPFVLGSYLAFWGMLVNSLSYSAVTLAIFWLNVGVILGSSRLSITACNLCNEQNRSLRRSA